MEINIKGLTFSCLLLSPEDYVSKHGDGSQALCDREELTLEFRKDHVSRAVIRHELMHAYIRSTFIKECSQLEQDDFEEVICEIVAHHSKQLESYTNMIFNQFKGE